MSSIRNIIFDFGKVLVDYDWGLLISLSTDTPEQYRRLEAIVCDPEFMDLCDKGDIPFAEIIRLTQQKYPDLKDQLQRFKDRQIEVMTGEVPGMRDLLLRLRAEGYMLYGLTNWSETVYPVIRRYDILRLLDNRLVSSEEHLIKPDERIYHRICEKFSLKEEECVFTDDKPVNVKGAVSAGMKAIVFENAAQFERDLREIL